MARRRCRRSAWRDYIKGLARDRHAIAATGRCSWSSIRCWSGPPAATCRSRSASTPPTWSARAMCSTAQALLVTVNLLGLPSAAVPVGATPADGAPERPAARRAGDRRPLPRRSGARRGRGDRGPARLDDADRSGVVMRHAICPKFRRMTARNRLRLLHQVPIASEREFALRAAIFTKSQPARGKSRPELRLAGNRFPGKTDHDARSRSAAAITTR